jgi:hypothetical protein
MTNSNIRSENNYWTPLADQVEESEDFVGMCNDALEENEENNNAAPMQLNYIVYRLPFGGSTNSRDRLHERRLEKLKDKRAERKALKQRVMNGQDPYGWLDSGATSNFIAPQDKKHIKSTGIKSNKQVRLPNGQHVSAGEKINLENGLSHPANTANSIPSLKTTLISNSKLADAGYITVFNEEEVNVYDGATTKVVPTEQAILTGWRDKQTGLWHFPLKTTIKNQTTDTSLLSKNDSTMITEEIAANVHDLPSTEQVIKYLHAAAGFPAKPTWLQAIRAGFYATWPMLNAKSVNKYFHESEEMQKGHMRQKRSGVRKTNRRIEFEMLGDDKEIREIEVRLQDLRRKHKDVKVRVYKCTGTVYSDQTGRFPFTSSRRNKYNGIV